jgi:hypothetical protein
MGWLTRRNVTRDWQELTTPLVLDLDALTLTGAECGDPADGLSFLGPGEPGVLSTEFHFPAKGVTLDVQGGDLRGIHVHTRPNDDELHRGIRPFAGVIRHRGATLDPAAVDEAAAVARFGPPDAIDDVTDDRYCRRVLTYLPDGTEWELLFGPDGRLEMVSLY